MRKISKIVLFSASAVAALSLAACGNSADDANKGGTTTSVTTTGKTNTTTASSQTTTAQGQGTTTSVVYEQDTKGLDICINYSKSGITAQSSFTNKVENQAYTQKQLLPVWKTFEKTLKTTIREGSNYSAESDDSNYTTVKAGGYASQDNPNEKIDLFYNTTNNITTMGNSGEAVNLMPYIKAHKMPYFEAYLANHPEVRDMIVQGEGEDEKLYYTPYFDGYNDYERSLVFDVDMVKAILDSNKGDSTNNGAGAQSNVLQAPKFKPFMDDNYNYPNEKTSLKVTFDGSAKNIIIPQVENIIKQQNALLAQGCTGLQLADQFREYLNQAYGDYIGTGVDKIYTNKSDIFISAQACYNTDELIALMRVIKANPGVITGDEDKEIEILFPRGEDDNRVNNILQFASVFGVQGVDSEYRHLYYDGNGCISNAETTQATFDAVVYLSQLYDEGLIIDDFHIKAGRGKTCYLDSLFGHVSTINGYTNGFMMYDFTAATGSLNTLDENNVGTRDDKRIGEYEGNSVTGIRPVLPPYTYWNQRTYTNDEVLNQKLSDKTGKTLMRYTESNRSIKGNSWCIPQTSDNKEKAVQLMDYIFSQSGTYVNDFGPSEYWDEEPMNYLNEYSPQLSNKAKLWIKDSGLSFWDFMRQYLGATYGIGSVREASLNYAATNAYAQTGMLNLQRAISTGTVTLAKGTDKHIWGVSVPTTKYGSASTSNESYAAILEFWAQNGKLSTTASGWVKVVESNSDTYANGTSSEVVVLKDGKNYTYDQVLGQRTDMNKNYLYDLLSANYSSLMPAYIRLK